MADFEKDMQKLQQISAQLETGELGIEKSMELYADGMKLADDLLGRLEKYRAKIEILEGEAKEP